MIIILQEVKWNEIQKLYLDKEEQEFTLTALRDDEYFTCFCSDNNMLKKLKDAMKQNPTEYKCYIKYLSREGKVCGYEFKFPKKYLRLMIKDRKYSMTEEQRIASKERMLKAREMKNN